MKKPNRNDDDFQEIVPLNIGKCPSKYQEGKENFESFLRKQCISLAAKYTFLTSQQIRQRALEMWKKKMSSNSKTNNIKRVYTSPMTSTPKKVSSSKADKGNINRPGRLPETTKHKRSLVPLKVELLPAEKPGIMKRDGKLNSEKRHVSFKNEPEIRYRTTSEESSTSTLNEKKKGYPTNVENETSLQKLNCRSYSKGIFQTAVKKRLRNTEMEKKFDVLLNSKCSWSYRSKKILSNKTANGFENNENSSVEIQKTITKIHISKQDNCSSNANNITKAFSSTNVPKIRNNWLDTENQLEEDNNFEFLAQGTEINNFPNRSNPINTKPVRKKKIITKETDNFGKTNRTLRNGMPKNYKETESFSSSSEDEEVLQTRLSVKNANELKTIDLEENIVPNSDKSHVSISNDSSNESEETDAVSTKGVQITENETYKASIENESNLYKTSTEDNFKETKNTQNEDATNSSKQDLTDILQINEFITTDSMSVEVSNSSYNQESIEGIFNVNNSPEDIITDNNNSLDIKQNYIKIHNEDQIQKEILNRCLDFSKEIQSVCSELEMPETFLEETITNDFFSGKFDVVKYKLQGSGCAEKSLQTFNNELEKNSKTLRKNSTDLFSNSAQFLKVAEYIKSAEAEVAETNDVSQNERKKHIGKSAFQNIDFSIDKEVKYDEKLGKNLRKTTRLQKKSLTHKILKNIPKKLLEIRNETTDQTDKENKRAEDTSNSLENFSFLGIDETGLSENKNSNLVRKENNSEYQENNFTAWNVIEDTSRCIEESDDAFYSKESKEIFPHCEREQSLEQTEKRKNMARFQEDGLQQLRKLKVQDHINKEESFKYWLETMTEDTESECKSQGSVTNRNDKNKTIPRKQPINKYNILDIHSTKFPYQKISSTYSELPETNVHDTDHNLETIIADKCKSSNKTRSVTTKSVIQRKNNSNIIKKQKINKTLVHNIQEKSEEEFQYEDKITCSKNNKLMGENNTNKSLLPSNRSTKKTNKNSGIQSKKGNSDTSKGEKVHNSKYSTSLQTNKNSDCQNNEIKWFSENPKNNFLNEIKNLKSTAKTNFVRSIRTEKLQQNKLNFNPTTQMWEDLENELLSNEISNKSHNSSFVKVTNNISNDISKEIQIIGRGQKPHSLEIPEVQETLNDVLNNSNKNCHFTNTQLIHSKSCDSSLASIRNNCPNVVSKPAVHSPSTSIVDKTIAAMEKCASEYIFSSEKFQQQNSPVKNLEEYDSESKVSISDSLSSIEELQSAVAFTEEKFSLSETSSLIEKPIRKGNHCKNTESKKIVYETKKLWNKFKNGYNKNKTSKEIEFFNGNISYKSDISLGSNPINTTKTRLKLNKSATVMNSRLYTGRDRTVHENCKTNVHSTWNSLIEDLDMEENGKIIPHTNEDITISIKNDSSSENEAFLFTNYQNLENENSIKANPKSLEKADSSTINERSFSRKLNTSSLKHNECKKQTKKCNFPDDVSDSSQSDNHSENEMFAFEKERFSENNSVKVSGETFNNQFNNSNIKYCRKRKSTLQYKTKSVLKKEKSKKQIQNTTDIHLEENLNHSFRSEDQAENEAFFKSDWHIQDDNLNKQNSKSPEKSDSRTVIQCFNNPLTNSNLKCYKTRKRLCDNNLQYRTDNIKKSEFTNKKHIKKAENKQEMKFAFLDKKSDSNITNDSNSENEIFSFTNYQNLENANSIKVNPKSLEKADSRIINEQSFSKVLNTSSLKHYECKKQTKQSKKCNFRNDLNDSSQSDSDSENEMFAFEEEQYSGNNSVKVTGEIFNNQFNDSNTKHCKKRKRKGNLQYKMRSIMNKENNSKRRIQNTTDIDLDENLTHSFRSEDQTDNEAFLFKSDQHVQNDNLNKHNSKSSEKSDLRTDTQCFNNQVDNSNLKCYKTRKWLGDDNLQYRRSNIKKNEFIDKKHIKTAENKQEMKFAVLDEKSDLDVTNKEELISEVEDFSIALQDNQSVLLQNENLSKQLKENMLEEFSCTNLTRIEMKNRNLGSGLITNQLIKKKTEHQIMPEKNKNDNSENKNSDTDESKMLVENLPTSMELTQENVNNPTEKSATSHFTEETDENLTLIKLSSKNSMLTNNSNERIENSRAQNITKTDNESKQMLTNNEQKQKRAKEKYIKYLNKKFKKLDRMSEIEQSQCSSVKELPAICRDSEKNEISSSAKDKWKSNLIAQNKEDLFSLSSSDSDDSSITSLKKFKGTGLLCELFED